MTEANKPAQPLDFGSTVGLGVIPREEWMRRYAARVMEVAGLLEHHAIEVAKAGVEAYEESDDAPVVWWGGPPSVAYSTPEEEADEEMSCWEDDGDE